MTRTPPTNESTPADPTPEPTTEPATTPWKVAAAASTPWSGVGASGTPWAGAAPSDTSCHGGSLRDRLQVLTDRAEAIDRMLAAVPEDVQSPVDGRTREALSGYAQGLRDAVRELGDG